MGADIVAACSCGDAVGRSARERLSGTIDQKQAIVFGVRVLFRLRAHKHHATSQPPNRRHRRDPSLCRSDDPHEDFIERTLRERRSLQGALSELMTKYSRIPSGNERSMLERMIEVLKDEIALRQNTLRIAK